MSQSSAAVHGGYSALFSPALRATSITSIMAVFIGSLDTLIIGAALPTISQRLHGAELYAVALGAYLVASLMGMPLFGAMSDQTGPWRAFLIAASIFAAGALVGGFAPSMPALVFALGHAGLWSGRLICCRLCRHRSPGPYIAPAPWLRSAERHLGRELDSRAGCRSRFCCHSRLALGLLVQPSLDSRDSSGCSRCLFGHWGDTECGQFDKCSRSTATWPHRRCCDWRRMRGGRGCRP